MKTELTSAEYAILGLLVEKPRHGYDLEKVIEERGMREWTELAFSSIYYVLKRLMHYGLIETRDGTANSKRARKTYAPTRLGFETHNKTTLDFIAEPRPTYPKVLLGMANWPVLEPETAINALITRRAKLEKTLDTLIDRGQHPLGFVAAMFDLSVSQIRTEIEWIDRTIESLDGIPNTRNALHEN